MPSNPDHVGRLTAAQTAAAPRCEGADRVRLRQPGPPPQRAESRRPQQHLRPGRGGAAGPAGPTASHHPCAAARDRHRDRRHRRRGRSPALPRPRRRGAVAHVTFEAVAELLWDGSLPTARRPGRPRPTRARRPVAPTAVPRRANRSATWTACAWSPPSSPRATPWPATWTPTPSSTRRADCCRRSPSRCPAPRPGPHPDSDCRTRTRHEPPRSSSPGASRSTWRCAWAPAPSTAPWCNSSTACSACSPTTSWRRPRWRRGRGVRPCRSARRRRRRARSLQREPARHGESARAHPVRRRGPARPHRAVAGAIRVHGRLPGFGHPLYPHGDPRAAGCCVSCARDTTLRR